MLLIETAEAVENIDSICAVPGIDIAILAPFDLSTELGVSGQFDHPRMLAAGKRIEDAARKAHLPLGGAAFTKEATQALIARGYRLFGGFDILWVRNAVAQSRSWLGNVQ
jgi:4-hydroxy-2-oxoheptanedioate aldolase